MESVGLLQVQLGWLGGSFFGLCLAECLRPFLDLDLASALVARARWKRRSGDMLCGVVDGCFQDAAPLFVEGVQRGCVEEPCKFVGVVGESCVHGKVQFLDPVLSLLRELACSVRCIGRMLLCGNVFLHLWSVSHGFWAIGG